MADNTDPVTLARSIGNEFGVRPVAGVRVEEDQLVLPIVGRELSMVGVALASYYLRLHFWGMPDFVLEVEGSGSMKPSPAADRLPIAPRAGTYPEVIALVGQPVVEAIASREGALRIAFASGSSIDIDAPSGYETWQLRDDASEYIVVTNAGGGIVQFGEPEASLPQWKPVPASAWSRGRAWLRRALSR